MHNHLKNERGVTLPFTAVALAAFIGLTVIGVDLARLAFTATEVQTVADLAATAAAQAVYDNTFRGASRVPDTDGHTVAHQNKIDGLAVPMADNAGADINVHIEVGRYDSGTQTFTANAQPLNAAKATGHRRVTNFIAAAVGSRQTKVEKDAIAPIVGPATGCTRPSECTLNDWACYCQHGVLPCLPLSAADCRFNSLDQLPSLTISPGGTAFWTGFQTGHSSDDVRPYLDQGPCDPNGGGGVAPVQSVGGTQQIDVTNGISPACSSDGKEFGLMKCIFESTLPGASVPGLGCSDANNDGIVDTAGGRMFAIPIFHQSSCDPNVSGKMPLVGFATVELTSVCVGGDTNINVNVVRRNTSGGGPVGGGCFGTDCSVRLIH